MELVSSAEQSQGPGGWSKSEIFIPTLHSFPELKRAACRPQVKTTANRTGVNAMND